jgi:hypothetical protein
VLAGICIQILNAQVAVGCRGLHKSASAASAVLSSLGCHAMDMPPSAGRKEQHALATPAPHNSTHLQVAEMLDCAFYDQSKFLEGGWVDGLKYEDEILDLLRVSHPVSLCFRFQKGLMCLHETPGWSLQSAL